MQWDDPPAPVMHMLILELDAIDLLRACLVCKRWKWWVQPVLNKIAAIRLNKTLVRQHRALRLLPHMVNWDLPSAMLCADLLHGPDFKAMLQHIMHPHIRYCDEGRQTFEEHRHMHHLLTTAMFHVFHDDASTGCKMIREDDCYHLGISL